MKLNDIIDLQEQQTIEQFILEADQLLSSFPKSLLENIEWEPQPEWRGVGGTTRETGAGIQQRARAERTKKIEQIQAVYKSLVAKKLKGNLNAQQQKLVDQKMQEIEGLAAKYKFALPNQERATGV